MGSVLDKSCRENQNTRFIFRNFFFPENRAVYIIYIYIVIIIIIIIRKKFLMISIRAVAQTVSQQLVRQSTVSKSDSQQLVRQSTVSHTVSQQLVRQLVNS